MKYTAIKTEIKKLAASQKELKPRRKTSSKDYSASAQWMVEQNSYYLRHLHSAYNFLKGRGELIPSKKSYDTNYTKKLVEQFEEKIVINS